MINIESQVEPFSFKMNNREYHIDFVNKVLGIDDESGAGKTMFIKDILTKQDLVIRGLDNKTIYTISAFSANTQKDTIYNYILNADLRNKIVIIDDVEYIDDDLLLQGIKRSAKLNTQWVLLGHGNFVGIAAVDAIRYIKITKTKGSRNMKIEFAF